MAPVFRSRAITESKWSSAGMHACVAVGSSGHEGTYGMATGKPGRTLRVRFDSRQYKAGDYQWHKQTNFIKVHWSYTQKDSDTIIAEGFVEPFNPDTGVNFVKLKLVGLDAQDKVVSSAEGIPRDNYIESPFYPASPFRIAMKLSGKEKVITITGSYYYYSLSGKRRLAGSTPITEKTAPSIFRRSGARSRCDPSWSRQYSWLTRSVGTAPCRASEAAKSRPSTGRTPRTLRKAGET